MEDGRALLGPTSASITGNIAAGQTITAKIVCQNFGKEPASDVVLFPAISSVPADKWLSTGEDGAMYRINVFRDQCRKVAANNDALVVFPSNGVGQNDMSFKFAQADFRGSAFEPLNFEHIRTGDDILIINMCFAYKTFTETKHTAFCFFYNAKVSDANSLNFCDGAYAD